MATDQKPLAEQVKNLPQRPGIYIFRDVQSRVLYVGKAKSLKNRVRSYFAEHTELPEAKKQMVTLIRTIDTIIVADEAEALLLESKYIKEYRPPYNVLWKDDKQFLYLRINWNEPFPRVDTVRKIESETQDHESPEYFGPYPSARAVRYAARALHRLFPFRTCGRDLSKLPNGKVCLLYHIGQCPGPCEMKCSAEEYAETLRRLGTFLRKGAGPAIQALEETMRVAATEHRYETAAKIRDQITALRAFSEHQSVATARGNNVDVLVLTRSPQGKPEAVVTQLQVRDGNIARREHWRLAHIDGEQDTVILSQFISQYYQSVPRAQRPDTVLSPIPLALSNKEQQLLGITISIPVRGEKKRLLDLCLENTKTAWIVDHEPRTLKDPQTALALLRSELIQAGVPIEETNTLSRLECYDISNIQGNFAVGSQSVFIAGLPRTDQYRRYTIRSVIGPNDAAMHAEMMKRRLAHSVSGTPHSWPKPDLIIIDGGAPQLAEVVPVIRAFDSSIPVIGIAKRFEEIYIPNPDDSFSVLRLGPDHPALQIIQRIRDEAHRFGISLYRKKHRKASIRSPFDDIPGIGPKKKKLLKTTYGTFAAAAKAPTNELEKLVGRTVAEAIKNNLGKTEVA